MVEKLHKSYSSGTSTTSAARFLQQSWSNQILEHCCNKLSNIWYFFERFLVIKYYFVYVCTIKTNYLNFKALEKDGIVTTAYIHISILLTIIYSSLGITG